MEIEANPPLVVGCTIAMPGKWQETAAFLG